MPEMEELRELVTKITDKMHSLEEELIKSTYGTKIAAKSARVKTIELQKLFRIYRDLTLEKLPVQIYKKKPSNENI